MDNIEKIDLEKVDWQSSKEFFDSLKDELEKLDDHNESYDFTWAGKRKSIIEAGAPINKTLRPDVETSKDFDNTKNMLIVGDNLDALKLLQESYLGQVKMIYIDPPYNTGHDFVYHDNFTTKKDDYDDSSISEDGERIISEDEFIENSKSNGRFHSDWLSMIYPRLKLARNLLSDDGVIFISIDDNEQANLKKVCDEVFGEENFVASLIWERAYSPKNDAKYVSNSHDYVLFYAKNIDDFKIGRLPRTEEANSRYSNPDDDPRGEWMSDNMVVKTYTSSCDYPIKTPSGRIVEPPSGRCWRINKATYEKFVAEKRIWFGSDGNGVPRIKRFLIELKNEGMAPTSLLFYREVGHSQEGAQEVAKILDAGVFDGPKPVRLLKRLLMLAHTNPNSLILDFFAGSGTTGHAVMDLNAEDGGNRRYILVQWPEATNEKSEARKAGYETIDQITAERLRRVGEKVQKEHPEAKVDTGFRVFHIDDSNENKNIRKPLEEYAQESMLDMVDSLKSDRTPLDLLFGVIYASALPFDLHLETRKIGDNTVYLYGYLGESSGLVACFDDNISDDTIKEIAKLKPIAAVFKDSSFADSAAKINLSEHFHILSVDTKVKVI